MVTYVMQQSTYKNVASNYYPTKKQEEEEVMLHKLKYCKVCQPWSHFTSKKHKYKQLLPHFMSFKHFWDWNLVDGDKKMVRYSSEANSNEGSSIYIFF